ncbi:hypothetical protein TeGR_g3828, partial [Tetraparma gracilis]
MLQEYSDKEVSMLEQKVTEFRSVAAKAAEKEGKDDAFVNKAMQRLIISASELAGKEVVGKGAFGEVYRSDYRGATVAVKTVKVISEENLDRFQKEILLMGDLRHQNIVTLIGAVWEKDLMGLVMEFCEKGTSSDVLKKEGSTFTWDDPLLKWCLDVSRGIRYLHSISYYNVESDSRVKGMLHRDLKPDNCLVTETYGIRIADFGEARTLNEDDEAAMTQ